VKPSVARADQTVDGRRILEPQAGDVRRAERRGARLLAGTLQIDALVRDAVDAMRLDEATAYDVTTALAEVRHAVRNAKPVPLTDEVRVPVDEARRLGAALRKAARV
jgi:hypothetical protein